MLKNCSEAEVSRYGSWSGLSLVKTLRLGMTTSNGSFPRVLGGEPVDD